MNGSFRVCAALAWLVFAAGCSDSAPSSEDGQASTPAQQALGTDDESQHNRSARRILIRSGYVLTMDGPDLAEGDVLIEGSRIVKVAPHIEPRGGGPLKIIDARGMVVMPGLIDNHRHMWQGVVPGISSNDTFGQYFARALDGVSTRLTPEDVAIGVELAAYEMVDAGVTTALDWSHGAYTAEHAVADIEALKRVGCRAIFAYGPPAASQYWFDSSGPPRTSDVRRVFREHIDRDGLVGFALAIRGPEFSTMQRVQEDIALARELGVRVTMHAGIPGFHQAAPSAQLIHQAGLMGSDLTFVHTNAMGAEDFRLIAEGGAHVSTSPEVEEQMGLGFSPVDAMRAGGARPTVSVDVVTAIGGSLFTQLRYLLQSERREAQRSGPVDHLLTTRAVLPYVTTYPAMSLGLERKIGAIKTGMEADIILVNMEDTNTFLREPSAALVQSAHPGNVDTVIVAGKILKANGSLVNADRLRDLRRRAVAANARLLAQ